MIYDRYIPRLVTVVSYVCVWYFALHFFFFLGLAGFAFFYISFAGGHDKAFLSNWSLLKLFSLRLVIDGLRFHDFW